ncbi:MAG: class I SAM-dependent methyltransferase [Candidatus Riflebacteria bacterium]|nr:class I SAM-dependent methyltransferase [Candidatus Riflebacteria bacterium]
MKQKTIYLLKSMKKTLMNEGFSCPSCENCESVVVARKFFFTALRRCKACKLLFRTPTTNAKENRSFYQEEYSQGFATDCPSDKVLDKLLSNGFAGGERDYSTYISVILAATGSTDKKLFDFGCSWGYGSWQLLQRGFNVEAYEISVPRADFARNKLGIKVYSSLSDVKDKFDVFFSSHVLEHVPSIKQSISFAMSILKPGGIFVAFTPNGSEGFRKKNRKAWNQLWGKVHPNFLDDNFYETAFPEKHLFLSSDPYSIQEISTWRNGKIKKTIQNLDGSELVCLVRK